MSDRYWTIDTSLFNGVFRYFGRGPVLVRGKVHTSQQQYNPSDLNQEIMPISITQGVRTHLHMCPFVLIPADIALPIDPYEQPRVALGEVTEGQEQQKLKELEIGNVQAWFYPDGMLVLRECFLHDFVRHMPLQADSNMVLFWCAVEDLLAEQFPEAKRIVTMLDSPMCDSEEYEIFLGSLGYERVMEGCMGRMWGAQKQS